MCYIHIIRAWECGCNQVVFTSVSERVQTCMPGMTLYQLLIHTDDVSSVDHCVQTVAERRDAARHIAIHPGMKGL